MILARSSVALRALPRGVLRASVGASVRVSASPRVVRSLATQSDAVRLDEPRPNASVYDAQDTFLRRHVGPRSAQIEHILQTLGYKTVEEFVEKTVPEEVRLTQTDSLVDAIPAFSEQELAKRGAEIAAQPVEGRVARIGLEPSGTAGFAAFRETKQITRFDHAESWGWYIEPESAE